MTRSPDQVDVYLETGKSRVFAGALHWPGWCRSGRDEDSALRALLEYAPRYARVLETTRLGFEAPDGEASLVVVERLMGTTTTDFGAPDVPPSIDTLPVDRAELERFQALLEACWQAFDAAVEAATGHALRMGPRGGGRDLEKIVQHVAGAGGAYLTSLGWKAPSSGADGMDEALERTRQEMLRGLAASAGGEIPERGPRGGLRWSPRYFVRREAWHVLDHTWEVEDRT